MIARDTTNKKSSYYKYYRGRGISVCDSWKKFENFLLSMGERPEGTTLDRIDNSLGYFPENCRWATHKQQQNNMRRNRLITYNGETLNITQWSEKLGVKRNNFMTRLDNGWDLKEIFETPFRKYKPRTK